MTTRWLNTWFASFGNTTGWDGQIPSPERSYVWGATRCPLCGWPDVQFALGIAELPDAFIDRIAKAMRHTERLDDETNAD